jgi:serine phosphatase RsbU (regulator of sigma subunit)
VSEPHHWSLPRPRAPLAVPIALILVITAVGALVPPDVHLASLLVAAPTTAITFSSFRFTVVVAFLAGAGGAVVDIRDGLRDSPILLIHLVALFVVSAFVILVSQLRDSDRRELDQVRAVSEAAQRVVLRPLPRRIGPLALHALYHAAAAQAQIGGDLYAAARAAGSARFIIGDARGKGLPAIDDAAALLGAFREAVHRRSTLPELTADLEESFRRHLSDLPDADRGEHFITALVLEIPEDEAVVRMISCGHPPPLLLRRGAVNSLRVRRPAPPLGLASLSPGGYEVDTFPLDAGDVMFLHTDGVSEARDAGGAFYAVGDRIAALGWDSPAGLLEAVLDDLLVHTGGHLNDDVAMVAVLYDSQEGSASPECRGRTA